jgi:hypothetical protein
MAICNKCGKKYLTKECLNCKTEEYKYNKEIKNLWKIAFFILLILSTLSIILAILKIQELENINSLNYQELNKIKIEKIELETKNQQLERKNNINARLIKSLKIQQRELVYKLRNYKNKLDTRYIKPKIHNNQKIQRKIKYTNNIPKTKHTHYRNTYKNKTNKKYNNYRGYAKLISDSKIQKRNDNRLKSNSAIYGLYKNPIIFSINCNNKKIYKIENECMSYASSSMDKLYFSKSNINELKYFDKKTHMIECKYNQKYGLMHDCRTKIFKYK